MHTLSDLGGLAWRNVWAGGLAPERELHGPPTDRRDEPAEYELCAEADRACRSEPNRDLTPHPLGPHHLAPDDPATGFVVHGF